MKEVQTMPKSRKTQTRKPAAQPVRKTARKSAQPAKPQRPATRAALLRVSKVRSPAAPARSSKKAVIVSLLERPHGAALSDLTGATGWQVHSVRAALTGLRKEGREVVRSKDESGVTHYRLPANA
jgi:hypothetical protein